MTDLTILSAYRDPPGHEDINMWAIYVDGVQLWWDALHKIEVDVEIMRAVRANLPITSCRFLSFQGVQGGDEGDPWFAENDPPDNLSEIPEDVMARARDLAEPD